MLELLLLLLPIAVIFGWVMGSRHVKLSTDSGEQATQSSYLLGLNYLINEQPDKAVDVLIKMLEVNSDTVETHLALGNLFRRRGEVERAIRVHQNLIARPQLSKTQKKQALLELAQDYMRAGMLDRAERLFLELMEFGGDLSLTLTNLVNIYQLQKDWQQAIAVAKKLGMFPGGNIGHAIAHYYCELAEQMRLVEGDFAGARDYIKEALRHDKNCVRANIILGEIFFNEGRYDDAIVTFKKIYDQDEDYVSEIVELIYRCYLYLGKEEDLLDYLSQRIENNPRIHYILTMVDYIFHRHGAAKALQYLSEYMSRCLSLRGLGKMLNLYVNYGDGKLPLQLSILNECVEKILVDKPIYRCVHCGFSGKNLYWQCPSCKRWNAIKPIHDLEGD